MLNSHKPREKPAASLLATCSRCSSTAAVARYAKIGHKEIALDPADIAQCQQCSSLTRINAAMRKMPVSTQLPLYTRNVLTVHRAGLTISSKEATETALKPMKGHMLKSVKNSAGFKGPMHVIQHAPEISVPNRGSLARTKRIKGNKGTESSRRVNVESLSDDASDCIIRPRQTLDSVVPSRPSTKLYRKRSSHSEPPTRALPSIGEIAGSSSDRLATKIKRQREEAELERDLEVMRLPYSHTLVQPYLKSLLEDQSPQMSQTS